MKRRILVTTGTRAEYGILRPLLFGLNNKKIELFLVVTGTHLSKKHGYTINEIKKDGFKISASFKMLPRDDTNYSMAVELGKATISFSKIFKKIKPDINLLIGDRDEMLASALAASRMNIPNAHIAGGDKSGGIDEYNRHAITKLSNIHFAATQKSKERILKMGEDPKHVFHPGSLNIDELRQKRISNKREIQQKYGLKLTGNEIILIQHPLTTDTKSMTKQIINTLNAVIKTSKPVIAIAPNSDAGGRQMLSILRKFSSKYKNFKLYPTFPRQDYLGLLKYGGVLVGNSSSGIIEASYFDIPVINIGLRQKNREKGKNIYDVRGESSDAIFKTLIRAYKEKGLVKANNHVYGDGNTAVKIVNILEKIKLDQRLIQKQIMY